MEASCYWYTCRFFFSPFCICTGLFSAIITLFMLFLLFKFSLLIPLPIWIENILQDSSSLQLSPNIIAKSLFLNSYNICSTLLSYLENRILLFLMFISPKVLYVCRNLPCWLQLFIVLCTYAIHITAFPLWAGWPAHSLTPTSSRCLAWTHEMLYDASRGLNQSCTLGIPCWTSSIAIRTWPC